MDCRKISKIVRKEKSLRFTLLYVISLMAFPVSLVMTVSVETIALAKAVLGAGFLLFVLSWIYTEGFLLTEKDFSVRVTGVKDTNLSSLAKFHSFNHDAYFSYIGVRFIFTDAVLILVSAVICFAMSTAERRTELFISLVFLIPLVSYGVLFIKKKIFQYYAVKSNRMNAVDFLIAVVKIFVFVTILVYGCLFMFGMFFVSVFFMKISVPDNVIAYQYAMRTISFTVPIGICFLVFIVSAFGMIVSDKLRNIMSKVIIVSVASLMILSGVNVWLSGNYILTSENGITVCEPGNKTKYSFEDVKSFDIYYSDKEYGAQFTAEMKDGEKYELFGTPGTMTEKFRETFGSFNMLEFSAYIAEKMESAGAEGRISDIDKLRSNADNFNYDQKAIDKIAEIVG